MQRARPCTICHESDHAESSCPELAAPLHAEEFFQPAGGMQGGDEEEDCVTLAKKVEAGPRTPCTPHDPVKDTESNQPSE